MHSSCSSANPSVRIAVYHFENPLCMVFEIQSERSSAWLERYVRDVEVAGSNPVAPTKENPVKPSCFAGFFRAPRDGASSSSWAVDD